jgi:DNA end-binding protein Ku
MAAILRSMWKGVIEFALVAIPVRVYLGADPHTSGAHLLHEPCRSRLQQRLWCPACGVDVARTDTVRGFEVAPDRWVMISDEEFDSLPVRTLHTIEVIQFVPAADAARLETWSRQPYYVAPERLGWSPFALFRATLEDTDLVAIAKIAIRDREHLATVRPLDDGLVLTTLAWPDEIRPIASLDLPPRAAVSEAELGLARQLVQAMARPFDPAAHRDAYAAALERLVESKAEGATFALPDAPPSAALVDLMAALEASVASAVAARDAKSGPRRVPRTPRSAARGSAA